MKRLALALLNIMLFLALVSSVSAYTFIDSNRDGFYIQIENGSIARYDHDVTRQWTRDGFNETTLLTVMPDGGVYANSVHSGTPESIRYNPDGSININSVTASLSTTNPSYGTYYDGVNNLMLLRGTSTFYTYDPNAREEWLTSTGTATGAVLTGASDYSRFYGDKYRMASSTVNVNRQQQLTDHLTLVDGGAVLSGLAYTLFTAVERDSSLSVSRPDRAHLSYSSTSIRTYDRDVGVGFTDAIYDRNLPAGYNMRGTGMIVWGANNNRLAVYGEDDSDSSFINIYTRDLNLVAGIAGLSHGDRSYFVDSYLHPDGSLMLLQYSNNQNGRVVKIPVGSAPFEYYDLGSPIRITTRFAHDDILSHTRAGFKMGLAPFESVPYDVFRLDANPAYSGFESYLTYDFVDSFDKRVELTVSDVTLDNLPIDFLVGHASGYHDTRFRAVVLERDTLREFNTSVINTPDTQTVTNVTPNYADYKMIEYELRLNLERLGSQSNVNAMVEFLSPLGANISGFSNNVSTRLSVERWYGSPSDSQFDNMIITNYDLVDTLTVVNHTRTIKETPTGGSIGDIVLRVIYDRTTSRFQKRLEVERDGARDTISASTWLTTTAFGASNANIEDIVLRVSESDTQAQLALTVYGYEKKPVFTTGLDSDYDSTRLGRAEIYDGGENVIRVYYDNPTGDFTTRNSVAHYEDWSYSVTLDNAIILGIPGDPFTPTPTDPTDTPSGGSWLQPFGGFSLAQSTFVYTVAIILLTWIIIMAYSIYVANLTGASWVTTLGAVASAIASMMWVFVSVFIGWTPVWVVVLLIVLGAGIVTVAFRRTFVT